MERNLGIERIYTLGEYQTLKVLDYINNIPEDLILDPDFVDKVRYLQLVNLDLVYAKYALLATKVNVATQKGSTERYSMLLEERANTLDDIKQLLENKKGE